MNTHRLFREIRPSKDPGYMCAIRFWDSFNTSSRKSSPKVLESILDMELLAKFSFRRLVIFTKSLESTVVMWFSDRSLDEMELEL